MARVIIARRPDRCRECGKPIAAGDRINYGGKDAVSCVGCRPLQAVKSYGRRRVYGGASYTGARCEDAPCCGCCD